MWVIHLKCRTGQRLYTSGGTVEAGRELAARARGIGSAWTTIHLMFEKEAAAVLGIPDNVTQAALLPVAYFTGEDFKPARRIPSREFTYLDTWGNKLS